MDNLETTLAKVRTTTCTTAARSRIPEPPAQPRASRTPPPREHPRRRRTDVISEGDARSDERVTPSSGPARPPAVHARAKRAAAARGGTLQGDGRGIEVDARHRHPGGPSTEQPPFWNTSLRKSRKTPTFGTSCRFFG